jgi:hypothetical protein
MPFLKYASAMVLGSWEGADASQAVRTAGLSKAASYFMQKAGSIDLEAALNDVAEIYAISKNPRDYLFAPVRANSVNVPNENGDAFSRSESLRFDHKIGRRVYQTYLLKPHHINHRADNPKMARGVIIDAHFNDGNEMPQEWKSRYEASTGLQLPKDEFIETLLAVDASKDPYLAKGMKTGVIDAFSMGCECERTKCSICANVASNRLEFCDHIRYGNKMKWFDTSVGKRQAFEWCEGVVYGELSAVDQPADPRALTEGGLLQMRASLQKLSHAEMLELVAFTRMNADHLPNSVLKILSEALS